MSYLKKGQYSAEYVIVIGIGISIIAAFVVYVMLFYGSFALSSSASQITTAANNLANEVNYVASQGPGSMQTFPITVPLLEPQYSFFCGNIIKLQTTTELGVSKPAENVSGMLPLSGGTFDAFVKTVNGSAILGLRFAISYISQSYTASGTTISYNLEFYNSSFLPTNSPVTFNISVFSTNGVYLGSSISSTSSSSPSTASGSVVASAYHSEYVIEVTPSNSGDYASQCVSSQQPVAYVPLTITSSSATSNPFQQEVTVNMNDYSSYAASNLQNIEFLYPNGTVIPSWRENGTSSTQIVAYWLKLGSFTSTTVYMDFFPESSNVLNTVNTGEAPQLSPTYYEYNDIASVMNPGLEYQIYVYPTSTCDSNGYQNNVYAATLNNGVSIQSCATFTSSTNPFYTPAEGTSQNVDGTTENYVVMNYQYGYSGGAPYPNPPISNPDSAGVSENDYSWIIKAIGWAIINSSTTFYEGTDDGIALSYSTSASSSNGAYWLGGTTVPDNVISAWHTQGFTTYSGTISTVGSVRLELDYYEDGGGAYTALWSNNPVTYYSPSAPPNGVMPSVSFGSVS
ncbi:MAG: hypothetical protein ACP5MV_00270 [Candidatus Parvarchaeum sp.]